MLKRNIILIVIGTLALSILSGIITHMFWWQIMLIIVCSATFGIPTGIFIGRVIAKKWDWPFQSALRGVIETYRITPKNHISETTNHQPESAHYEVSIFDKWKIDFDFVKKTNIVNKPNKENAKFHGVIDVNRTSYPGK